MRSGKREEMGWPGMLVGVAAVGTLGIVAIIAMQELEPHIDGPILIWTSCLMIINLVIGIAVGRSTVVSQSTSVPEEATAMRDELERLRNKLEKKSDALSIVLAALDPAKSTRLLQEDRIVQRAFEQ